MSLFFDGIGAVIKKLTNWIPDKEEARRNKIEKLREERHELVNGEFSSRSAKRVVAIDEQLHKLEQEAVNK